MLSLMASCPAYLGKVVECGGFGGEGRGGYDGGGRDGDNRRPVLRDVGSVSKYQQCVRHAHTCLAQDLMGNHL